MSKTISETDFAELKLLKRGKVRDVYDLGEHLLMIATDRISAFDVVMPKYGLLRSSKDVLPDRKQTVFQHLMSLCRILFRTRELS